MAVRTISTRLAIDGEAEYRKAVSSCATSLSTLKSNLALTESQFKGNANSMVALSAKGTALAAIYDKQKEKVATLEDALKNAQRAQSVYASRVTTAKENVERCQKALDDLTNSTGDTSAEQKALTEELAKWNAELVEAEGYEGSLILRTLTSTSCPMKLRKTTNTWTRHRPAQMGVRPPLTGMAMRQRMREPRPRSSAMNRKVQ